MTSAGPSGVEGLRRLAARFGIQSAYVDVARRRRGAGREALEAVLTALAGQPISDFGKLLAQLDLQEAARLLPPVHTVWLPGPASARVNLPKLRHLALECLLEAEDGAVTGWRAEPGAGIGPAGADAGTTELSLPQLSPGYYTLHVKAGRRSESSLIIAAPVRAYRAAGHVREWGAFLPLYALYSARSRGVGDFTDLRALSEWVRSSGGSTVATLPLLAAFYDEKLFAASPYLPASRLMWNEIYVDPERLPEFESSDAAKRVLASPGFQSELRALGSSRYVDYARLAAVKRSLLGPLSRVVSGRRRQEFLRFLRDRPEVSAYASFRARTERHGPWQTWPGGAGPDFDPEVNRHYAYAQWAAEAQMSELGDGNGARLYLDLPLGVHGAGYDTWRWPGSFVPGVSAGAPPDAFFSGGQNWGFPPLHPLADREDRYEYVIASVRHHLRYATRLRVDHVMGLHRLYFIPDGFDARDGVYVRYPADELYAIYCLESHRHQAEIVGENLGTVPAYVNRAMAKHGFLGMYVLPFELAPDSGTPVHMPKRSQVASLNTHDLPPFAAWWSRSDTAEREQAGQISHEGAALEARERQRQQQAALEFLSREGFLKKGGSFAEEARRGFERVLASSRAGLVMINLEDLWGETEPQNRPGTSEERRNWRRRARYSLEEMQSLPEVTSGLAAVDAERRLRRAP